MYTENRDEEVKLLKNLWTSQPTICPKCGGAELEHLHKKAKKVIVTGNALHAVKYTERSACSRHFPMNEIQFDKGGSRAEI